MQEAQASTRQYIIRGLGEVAGRILDPANQVEGKAGTGLFVPDTTLIEVLQEYLISSDEGYSEGDRERLQAQYPHEDWLDIWLRLELNEAANATLKEFDLAILQQLAEKEVITGLNAASASRVLDLVKVDAEANWLRAHPGRRNIRSAGNHRPGWMVARRFQAPTGVDVGYAEHDDIQLALLSPGAEGLDGKEIPKKVSNKIKPGGHMARLTSHVAASTDHDAYTSSLDIVMFPVGLQHRSDNVRYWDDETFGSSIELAKP